MIELHIHLEPHAGREQELEALYRRKYVPAIRIQKGFRRSALLKSRDALRQYQIDIAFDDEARRLAWVQSKEHGAVWPRIAVLCQRASWAGFDTVAEDRESP